MTSLTLFLSYNLYYTPGLPYHPASFRAEISPCCLNVCKELALVIFILWICGESFLHLTM